MTDRLLCTGSENVIDQQAAINTLLIKFKSRVKVLSSWLFNIDDAIYGSNDFVTPYDLVWKTQIAFCCFRACNKSLCQYQFSGRKQKNGNFVSWKFMLHCCGSAWLHEGGKFYSNSKCRFKSISDNDDGISFWWKIKISSNWDVIWQDFPLCRESGKYFDCYQWILHVWICSKMLFMTETNYNFFLV